MKNQNQKQKNQKLILAMRILFLLRDIKLSVSLEMKQDLQTEKLPYQALYCTNVKEQALYKREEVRFICFAVAQLNH